jgi:putative FmdB family regulatory protein
MPIYVYQAKNTEKSCEHCREEWEIFQKISEDALTLCPNCHNEIHRIITTVGFKEGKKYLLTDENIKKKGFTKLVNEGNGKFRKI